MSLNINIIARSNGVGLDSDVVILTKALELAGHNITFSHCRSRKFFQKWFSKKNEYDVNIFLERVFPVWFGAARVNILIPNQERFPKRHISRLKKIDQVFCKSQHAHSIFSKLNIASKYIGFTSKEVHLDNSQRDYNQFLHLAGSSTLKGTDTILNLWEKHPEWPILTILQHKNNAPVSVPENVRLITERLSEEELRKLTNEIGIHLCPSLSEGWGHYIVEGMSCEAVVVTTGAPPMNELVTSQRGITIPYYRSEPRHLGINYYVDKEKLEDEIQNLIAMSHKDKRLIGAKARDWYLENNTNFHRSILAAIEEML